MALTGATGFIGTTLLNQLTQAGWHVRALYRPKNGRVPPAIPNVEWLAGDLDNQKAIADLVRDTYAVIHCAGVVRGASREDFDKVNEEGVRRVALAATQAGTQRFLLISSLAARMPELSFYAGSKYRGEIAVKNVADHMRWTIFRPPAVYGPGDRELLPLFKSMAHGFAPLPANANSRISLIYVDDLAGAMVHWLATDKGDESTFELDDGRTNGYDWDDIISIGGEVLRPEKAKIRRVPIPIFILKLFAHINLAASQVLKYSPMLTPGKVREITHSDWVCDNKQITQVTGWLPTFNFERGLAKIFDKNLKA
ncbi:MAG: NAD-dependent epimerase/dehydratase family protein [Gammaproteobacteria bacterium]|nr:NAD-dependent epimerase/dehydratase family protein [Gammaproteobacteria bacterium]